MKKLSIALTTVLLLSGCSVSSEEKSSNTYNFISLSTPSADANVMNAFDTGLEMITSHAKEGLSAKKKYSSTYIVYDVCGIKKNGILTYEHLKQLNQAQKDQCLFDLKLYAMNQYKRPDAKKVVKDNRLKPKGADYKTAQMFIDSIKFIFPND